MEGFTTASLPLNWVNAVNTKRMGEQIDSHRPSPTCFRWSPPVRGAHASASPHPLDFATAADEAVQLPVTPGKIGGFSWEKYESSDVNTKKT